MSAIQLSFTGCRFTLSAPAAVRAELELLYHPFHLGATAPAAALAGAFTVDRSREGWLLQVADEEQPLGRYAESVHALLAMEHAIEARILERVGRGVALHAGAVVVADGACLLMGRADSGKSSTTFHLAELGHAFLAEEIAVVDERGAVRPHLQSVALDPRVIEELPARGASRDAQVASEAGADAKSRDAGDAGTLSRIGDAAGGPAPPQDDRVDLQRAAERGRLSSVDGLLCRYMPRLAATAPVPLHTIVLPGYRPDTAPRVESPAIEETLVELLGYCFEPRGDQEAYIERLIELFSAARLLRVTYPDAPTARRLLAELFGRRRP